MSTSKGLTKNYDCNRALYLIKWFLRFCKNAALRICFLALMLNVVGIATTNARTVNKQLYLSDPSQALDRTDSVATVDATTA